MKSVDSVLKNLSDKELYARCRKWGTAALQCRWKFEGLLPEVSSRQLYKKRGFETIYDFARVLCGMSFEQVNRVFSVYRLLFDLPVLRNLLVEGKVSVNKLSRITSIATSKNQAELAEIVQKLSQKAIECYVRDIKIEETYNNPDDQRDIFEIQNGLHEPKSSVRAHKVEVAGVRDVGVRNMEVNKIGLAESQDMGVQNMAVVGQRVVDMHITEAGLKQNACVYKPKAEVITKNAATNNDFEIISAMSPELKNKIKELIDKGHDINKILLEMFAEREGRIRVELEEVSREVRADEREKAANGLAIGRYKKAKIRVVIDKKFGAKCGKDGCGELSLHVHHEKLFAQYGTHDPKFLKPLCKGHHEIEHAEDGFARRFRRATQ